MKELIDRFLAGQTTIEEEERLARYFRETRDLPDEWKAYRDMFAYLDGGMPIGELPEFDGVEHKPALRRRHTALWVAGFAAIAAAASFALFLTIRPSAVEQPVRMASVQTEEQEDSLKQSPETVKAPVKAMPDMRKTKKHDAERRGIIRHRYDIAPPKTYYAFTPDGLSSGDSISRMETEQQRLIAEQQQVERDIQESLRLVEEAKEQYMANGDFIDEEERY